MTRPSISLLDYGVGNLLSVTRAFEHCGAEVKRIATPEEIMQAERLVVPGVGAFGECVRKIREYNLTGALTDFAASGKPYLGICVGFQMMLEVGEEFGTHEGLGLFRGKVIRIADRGKDGKPHRIPVIGWMPLHIGGHNRLFKGIRNHENFYFIHSFQAQPANDEILSATYIYNGLQIPAAAEQGNVFGCQFHPEKSGAAGLQVLSNFLKI